MIDCVFFGTDNILNCHNINLSTNTSKLVSVPDIHVIQHCSIKKITTSSQISTEKKTHFTPKISRTFLENDR